MKSEVFLAGALGLFSVAPATAAPQVLVEDNFDASTTSTFDLNKDIERQTGRFAPITYSMAFGPNSCCGHQLQNDRAPNQLLLADFSAGTSSLDYDFSGDDARGGLLISFDLDPLPAVYNSSDGELWGGISLGLTAANQLADINAHLAHFGVLFRANGHLQAFDGPNVVSPNPDPVYTTSPGGSHHIDLAITDTDSNPFDGRGTARIEIYADHNPLPVYVFTKAEGYAHNYINLQSAYRSHFDNLVVARLPIDRTPVVANGGFETDTFTVYPGYVAGNGPITGWSARNGHGINPGPFGGPFTDNGLIPQGTKAAFLQEDGTFSQVIDGFIVGAAYQIRYFENARDCCSGTPPFMELRIGGEAVVASHPIWPVGGANPYYEMVSEPFVATATPLELAFIKSNPLGGDNTALLDQVQIFAGPTITSQPESRTNVIGSAVTFTVDAIGAPLLTYQWRLNGVNLPLAAGPSYVIGSAELSAGGSYSVLVANQYGAALSEPALLILSNVDDSPPALADNFVDRGDLAANVSHQLQGNNCGASREANEPFHAGKVGGKSVWYRWTPDVDGIATISTSGSAFDTLLAVYAGSAVNALAPVASDDNGGGFNTSQVQFNAVAGTTYAIAIDGKGAGCGPFLLEWSFDVTAEKLPIITKQPRSRTVLLGESYRFGVAALGQNTYRWFFNEQAIPEGNGPGLVLDRVLPSDVGFYKVRVTDQNTGRVVESETAIVELGPVPTIHSVAYPEDLFIGVEPGGFAFAAADFQPAADFGSGLGIPVPRGGVGRQIWSNTKGSTAIAQCGVAPTATRWLLLSNATEGVLVITTQGSLTSAGQPMQSVATVYRQDVTGLPIYVPQVACAVANDPTRTYSIVRFFAEADTGYWIAADGVNSTGLIQVNWTHSPWPLVIQPSDQLTVPLGRSVNLGLNLHWNLGPDVTEPLSLFGWSHDQKLFLTDQIVRKFSNVQPADAGQYSVMTSNIAGVTNLACVLNIDPTLQTLVESTFDASSNEGWAAVVGGSNDQQESPAVFNAPDFHLGYLARNPAWTSWLAPAKFRGNQSAAYGGELQFDLRQSQAAVVLRGGGLTLSNQSILTLPAGEWGSYRIPLKANAGAWTLNGRLPTPADFLQVLGALTSLEILISPSPLSGSGDLDDVALVGPSINTTAYLVVRALSGNRVQLEWPLPARSLVLEESPLFNGTPGAASSWVQVPFPYLTNAPYISVILPGTAARRYYRLRLP